MEMEALGIVGVFGIIKISLKFLGERELIKMRIKLSQTNLELVKQLKTVNQ